jgi:hypothetical protein
MISAESEHSTCTIDCAGHLQEAKNMIKVNARCGCMDSCTQLQNSWQCGDEKTHC